MTRTPDRYGRLAAGLHWAGAGLVLALLLTGFRAAAEADPAAKAALLRLHAPLGAALFALTALRALNALCEAARGLRPGPAPGTPRWQARAAGATHLALYLLMIGMSASGFGMLALSGAAPAIFGSAALPDFHAVPPRLPHGMGARLLLALVVLHVAAALHHALARRDGMPARMAGMPGRTRP
jgi:cytochrome b561